MMIKDDRRANRSVDEMLIFGYQFRYAEKNDKKKLKYELLKVFELIYICSKIKFISTWYKEAAPQHSVILTIVYISYESESIPSLPSLTILANRYGTESFHLNVYPQFPITSNHP